MAGRRIIYALVLTGSLIFFGAYQKWFSWILLLTVILFPWLSLLLSLGAMLLVKLESSASSIIPIESNEIIQLKVTSTGPQPPHKSKLCITKQSTGEKWILNPGEKLPTEHCGSFSVQLHKPSVYDYLGIFRFKIRKNEPHTFFVWPKPLKTKVPHDLTHYLARSWRPKPGGGYAENHEIRQYRPGDNLNQIHWKLSAKVGDLMLREPMEPAEGLRLLTMDLCGTPSELDREFGHLLWLSNWLLEQRITFEIRALTGKGIESWAITDEPSLQKCMEVLLCAPLISNGSILDANFSAVWQHHIGGASDEV